MKTNLCQGLLFETEEGLQELVGIEEYLDMEFDKGNSAWETDWVDSSDGYESSSFLAMDL